MAIVAHPDRAPDQRSLGPEHLCSHSLWASLQSAPAGYSGLPRTIETTLAGRPKISMKPRELD